MQAVARRRDRWAERSAAPDQAALVEKLALGQGISAAPTPTRLRWVSASVGDTINLFGIDDVLFFQSDERYTRLVTTGDEAHVRKSLGERAEGLDPEEFRQVHCGTIVRAGQIVRATRDDLGRYTLHPKAHAEKLAVSQAWAWRSRKM